MQVLNPSASVQCCSGVCCRPRQPGNVSGWIQAGTARIDHASVVRSGTYLGMQLVTRNYAHLVTECARNYFCFVRVIAKMHLLVGDFEMSAAREVAIDAFVAHDLLDRVNGSEGSGKHTASAFASE